MFIIKKRKIMNKMSTIENFLFIFLVFPLSVILSGLVTRYGWNNILTTLDGFPSISLAQAIGFNLLIRFFVGIDEVGENNNNDDDLGKIVSLVISKTILYFVLLWFVTLFL